MAHPAPSRPCDQTSPGCVNCDALALAKRLKPMGSPKHQVDGDPRTSGPGFGLTVHEDALELPRRSRQGRMVFVNSMSDLFHPAVPLDGDLIDKNDKVAGNLLAGR